MKAFASWSGGKESALSCYKAMQGGNLEVSCFLNMISEDGEHSRSHGINSGLIRAQAEAAGVDIVQKPAAWKTYEGRFKEAVTGLKEKGIYTGIFGDIDLQQHRDWVERVCKEMSVTPQLPLWNRQREELVKEFIDSGFKAVIVAVSAPVLGKEWLGREINREFVREIGGMSQVDLCGEKGEYHSFVYDGPIFKKRVEFNTGRKILRDKHWFLELSLQ
jgi:uncharacterized protein (TIGR00290 family)